MAFVFAPDKKRIVEDTAIHAYGAIYFVLRQCGSANDHAFGKVVVDATLSYLSGKSQIRLIKYGKVIAEWNIARAYFAFLVGNDGVYCNGIVLYEFVAYRQ